MPDNEYTPAEALDLIMGRLRQRDPQLAGRIQAVIDGGKDIQERVQGRRADRPRYYRRTVRMTDADALQALVDSLRAVFVEQPLFVNSALMNSRFTAIGLPVQRQLFPSATTSNETSLAYEHVGEDKEVEIELQTETQISQEDEQTMALKQVDEGLIQGQLDNLQRLRHLVTFDA